MPVAVNSVLVVIASPGDAIEERATVRDALTDWSVTAGLRQGVIALPWLFERHAVARMGGRPQALINSQAVDQADVVVAFFDARLGTDTGIDVSGTAEEIHRAVDRGTPVHVYFSTEALPRDVDIQQLDSLNKFRDSLQAEGLLGNYGSPHDLGGQVARAIQADVDEKGWGRGLVPGSNGGASLTWRHVHDEESGGFDKNGKARRPRTLRNDLVVTNGSDIDAENLTFTLTAVDEQLREHFHLEEPDGPVTIHGRSERGWTLIPMTAMTLKIQAQWNEGGLPCSQTRTITAR